MLNKHQSVTRNACQQHGSEKLQQLTNDSMKFSTFHTTTQ